MISTGPTVDDLVPRMTATSALAPGCLNSDGGVLVLEKVRSSPFMI